MDGFVIPEYTRDGFLPPFMGDALSPEDRSPYLVTPQELVSLFGTSPERRALIRGFLAFRRRLRLFGFVEGFQWIDGSFVEQVELKRGRPPADIDVVTFVGPAVGYATQEAFEAACRACPEIFEAAKVKRAYGCDAYFVNLTSAPGFVVDRVAYWAGLLSHTRTKAWKGILALDLCDDGDLLESMGD
jgi:hypothetical protein